MSKETIAVDADEVIFPFLDGLIEYHHEQTGVRLNKSSFKSQEFAGPFGLTVPETVERVSAYTLTTEGQRITPIKGSREGVMKLSSVFDLVVITSRDSQFERLTLNWMEQEFPGHFKGIKAIGYAPVMELPITKAEVCRDLGAMALIDDGLGHVSQCAEAGIEGILFGDYPWNECSDEDLPRGVTRCINWAAVTKHFNID